MKKLNVKTIVFAAVLVAMNLVLKIGRAHV